jgi:hypothetical protein
VWPGRALELSLLGRKAVTNKTNGVSKSKKYRTGTIGKLSTVLTLPKVF